jgi:hypothetical protein
VVLIRCASENARLLGSRFASNWLEILAARAVYSARDSSLMSRKLAGKEKHGKEKKIALHMMENLMIVVFLRKD